MGAAENLYGEIPRAIQSTQSHSVSVGTMNGTKLVTPCADHAHLLTHPGLGLSGTKSPACSWGQSVTQRAAHGDNPRTV